MSFSFQVETKDLENTGRWPQCCALYSWASMNENLFNTPAPLNKQLGWISLIKVGWSMQHIWFHAFKFPDSLSGNRSISFCRVLWSRMGYCSCFVRITPSLTQFFSVFSASLCQMSRTQKHTVWTKFVIFSKLFNFVRCNQRMTQHLGSGCHTNTRIQTTDQNTAWSGLVTTVDSKRNDLSELKQANTKFSAGPFFHVKTKDAFQRRGDHAQGEGVAPFSVPRPKSKTALLKLSLHPPHPCVWMNPPNAENRGFEWTWHIWIDAPQHDECDFRAHWGSISDTI